MTISIAAAIVLAEQCAPAVAPETLLSVVQVESGFNPLAIGVNGSPRISTIAAGLKDAVAQASALIAAGRNLDLGLAQINSKNLAWLGLSVEDAFDPCRNLSAGARLLQDGYSRARRQTTEEQTALATALSLYNTGKPRAGLTNGYVAKVTRAAAHIVPAIHRSGEAAQPAAPTLIPVPSPEPPAWDVFARSRDRDVFVVRVSASIGEGIR